MDAQSLMEQAEIVESDRTEADISVRGERGDSGQAPKSLAEHFPLNVLRWAECVIDLLERGTLHPSTSAL